MTELKATADDIRYAYRLMLGREPEDQGYASHLKLLEKSSPSVVEFARGFLGSREFIARFGCLVEVPNGPFPPRTSMRLQCQACTRYQIESPSFLYWAQRLGERPGGLHRKLWEWCFISQALFERGFLHTGSKGLGFAVGTEPLTALYAAMGCDILATDLDQALAQEAGWVDSNQHAAGLQQLNCKGLCPPDDFSKRVSFQNVNMRDIPAGLQDFDFLWSSCALEHLGSLDLGAQYVVAAMDCLCPGGIAVHTTELNCESDVDTVETGGSVVYRKRDLLQLVERLRGQGYTVEPLDFDMGETPADQHVDDPPYSGSPHLKLRIGGYASTSFGLIVTKPGKRPG